MKNYTLPIALACAFTAFLGTSASASSVCPNGRLTANCMHHLSVTKQTGLNFANCINELLAEYSGLNASGSGKGPKYRAKKQECIALAKYVMDDIKVASPGPDADTSDSAAVAHALEELEKEGTFELSTE